MSSITVSIDNRVRLVGAVLAASNWPDKAQDILRHAVHPHAKLTRHFVTEHRDHAAVKTVNDALSAGVSLTDLFTAVVRAKWPTFDATESLPETVDPAWLSQLGDFYTDTGIAAFFWAEHEEPWTKADEDLKKIFKEDALIEYLAKVQGHSLKRTLNIVPNLTYPSLNTIVAYNETDTYLIIPPPKAVGESPPWPYGEGESWVLAESCRSLTSFLLASTMAQLNEQQQKLLRHGATVMFLDDHFDPFESRAYLVQKRKQESLPRLAEFVEKLRAHLDNDDGRSLLDMIQAEMP
ncbi:MAG TPA: hypothetical protein VLL52_01395 [Anaerolineae bacterium]|nr:hypothetical protein [Anaerolineae bacterium]